MGLRVLAVGYPMAGKLAHTDLVMILLAIFVLGSNYFYDKGLLVKCDEC